MASNAATATGSTTVTLNSPEVEVVGFTGPTSAAAGSFATYSFTVRNNGGAAASNVVPVMQLPAGSTEVSASTQGTYDATTSRVTFPTVATLNAGASVTDIYDATKIVTYRVQLRVPASGTYTVRASSTASTSDPVPTNNTNLSATTTITQVADVSITANGPAQALPGASITYNALVTNYGPSPATNVTAQLTFSGSTPAAGTVTVGGSGGSYSSGIVTFSIPNGGTLASGASASYTIRFPAPMSGSVMGTVASTVATTSTDPVLTNNNGSTSDAKVQTAILTTLPSNQCVAFPPVLINGVYNNATSPSINTYYAGTATANAGQKVISIGAAAPVGTPAPTALAAGDLVAIVQVQGADIFSNNDGSYGNGVAGEPGNGQKSTNLTAGQYEYGEVASVTGTSITLKNNLVNTYQSQGIDATNKIGQKRFQVIRVPKYQSLILQTNVTNVPAWNGRTGGILILDIAGQFDMGGHVIDLKGKGFRGGAGLALAGTGTPNGAGGDYFTAAPGTAPTATPTTVVGANASKGEGIAGTPRYVNDRGTAALNTGEEGYPAGSFGRGAPGNAGGGGTDSNANNNDENTGGGGGSNAGTGGFGGTGWSSNQSYGGNGGAPYLQASPSRLVMGGGGGAGTTNNATGTPAHGFASSGAAGGGIVLIRASTVSANPGTIDVSGSDMNFVPDNDGSGGGGGGGSVLLIANNSLTSITILAKGGKGGSNTGTYDSGTSAGIVADPHGPGGGGSGGVAFTSSPTSSASSFVPGDNGTTRVGTGSSFAVVSYGATAGTTATPPNRSNVTPGETPLLQTAANCVADVTTTLTGPSTVPAGEATGQYTVTFTNNGLGPGTDITRTVTLPSGATMTTTQVGALPSGATYDAVNRIINFGTLGSQPNSGTASFTFSFTGPTTPTVAGATVPLTSNTSTTTNQGSNAAPDVATINLTVNNSPIAQNVSNVTIANNNGAVALSPNLRGTAFGTANGMTNSIASYTIVTLPATGTLTYMNAGVTTTVTPNTTITAAQLASLSYTPVAGSTTTQAFTYTVTDASGLNSSTNRTGTGVASAGPATYTIPVGSAPIANDDDVTTPLNTAITFNVTGNDQANGGSAIDPATIDLDPNAAGIQTSFTNAEGTFTTVGAPAGLVKFTPINGFVGIANTPYTVRNLDGALTNQANLIVRIESQLDLATTINGPAGAVLAGSQVTFTGTTKNNSLAGTTANAIQSLLLPMGLTGNVTITQNGASSTFPISATTTSTGVLTFATLTNFAAGSTSNFSIAFTAPLSGPIAVSALVTPTAGDINQANNVATAVVAITPQTDLSTTITGPSTNPVKGAQLTYAVTTGNAATSSPATSVVQTVQVPAGISGVFATNGGVYSALAGAVVFDGVSYTVAANTVTFPPVNLAAGQVVNNTLSFAAPTVGATLVLTATVPTTNEPSTATQANNSATATILTVQPPNTDRSKQANLYVTISGPAQAMPDAANNYSVTYTVNEGNDGPTAADNVQTVVSLPAGLNVANVTFTVDGAASTAPTYNATTGVVTFPALSGTAAQGSTASKVYTITLKGPAATTAISATASVTSSTTDPMAGNNVATTQTEILPAADVSITLKSIDGNNNVTAAQLLSYAVQTKNNSAFPAQNVQQAVSIQPNLSVTTLQLNGSTGSLSGGVITFASGATYTVVSGLLTLPAVGSLTRGALLNNIISFLAPAYGAARALATVSISTPETNLANNSAILNNGIDQVVDLTVSLAGPTKAIVGSPVEYTVTTTNNGPSVIGAQTTTVQLPTGLVGVEVRDNSGNVVAGAYSASTGVVTFASTTIVEVGQSTQGTITFLMPNTPQFNLAAAVALDSPTSNKLEANLDNNSARLNTSAATSALSSANLATTFTAAPAGPQAPGALLTYKVRTANAAGSATAQSPVQLVSLPVGLGTTSFQVNGVNGTLSAGVITFGSGASAPTYDVASGLLTILGGPTLAASASVENTITFPAPASSLTLTANSAMNNPDSDPANNVVRTTTTIAGQADVAVTLNHPATAAAGSPVNYAVVATNNGPVAATNTTVKFTIPAGVTSYTVNGTTIGIPASASPTTVNLLPSNNSVPAGGVLNYLVSFAAPTATYSVTTTVTADGDTNVGPGSNNVASGTTGVNIAPTANDVVNKLQSPEGNTATAALLLSPLSATDAASEVSAGTGSIASYTIRSIPNTTSQGVLFYNSATSGSGGTPTPVAPNQVLTTEQAKTLTFDPVSSYVGSVFFTYTATDNGNGTPAQALTSNVARYTIQVGADSSAFYTATPTKGGASRYATNDVLAFVIDPNGAQYNAKGAIYTTADVAGGDKAGTLLTNTASGLRTTATTVNAALDKSGPTANPTNVLPSGVLLNPTTGQIYVSDATQLPKITAPTTYSVFVITTDVYGGVSRTLARFTIGAYPLPVELTVFTAQAVRNTDAALAWRTASEKNNDHFDVERSLNGTDFVKFSEVKGQGSRSTPTDYALTDVGIGAKVSGPVYYRLKQVDTDGTATYSPVRTVTFTGLTPAIGLFPNPATATTQLDLTQLPVGDYQVSVLDATGRVILGVNLAAGLAHALDLHTVASGTYTVLVRGQSGSQVVNLTKRLIKE